LLEQVKRIVEKLPILCIEENKISVQDERFSQIQQHVVSIRANEEFEAEGQNVGSLEVCMSMNRIEI